MRRIRLTSRGLLDKVDEFHREQEPSRPVLLELFKL
jgi:hypothetical protein